MKKFMMILLGIFASCCLYAVDTSSKCPTTFLNSPCIEVQNTGNSEDILLSIQAENESLIKISPGTSASYLFSNNADVNAFSLEALINIKDLDSSCASYSWAVKLQQGQSFVVNNLMNTIYRYSYGLEEIPEGFKLVNCSSI